MAKTILVIYTDKKVSKVGYAKKYAFNTTDKIKVGELIKSPSYGTNMQIVKILPKAFKYFNRESGDLTDVMNNTNLYEIRDLKILSTIGETIVATRVKA